MNDLLETLVSKIEKADPLHGKRIRKNIKGYDELYFDLMSTFLQKYIRFLEADGKDLDFAINCYMKWLADFRYQHLRFMENGKYMSESFEEVNQRVYGNPEIMEWYYHGLLISQALWDQHYVMFSFFIRNLPEYKDSVKTYLEIGGGHGLFISEAIRILNADVDFNLLDISPTAIEMSKKFIEDNRVNYILCDIFKFKPEKKYDFITLGEVLEHIEEPVKLMETLKSFLSDSGTIFVTVPANAPTLDHLYLFHDADDIRKIFEEAGLEIVKETSKYAEDLPKEKLEKFKVTLEYGAFLKKIT